MDVWPRAADYIPQSGGENAAHIPPINALPSHTLCTVVFWMLAALAPCRAEFALRDGDRVSLGDSITTAQLYDRIIENYTLLRFPKLRVQFFNAGKGGDTAAGGLARLERDVFARKATVAIMVFGTNDIGWGVKADEEHRQKYFAGIRGIVEERNR